jgi:hypothetical protein
MRNSVRHFVDDERGMSLVFVCVGFMAMLSATTLAIDVGMFMAARSQAQNAADAGAHAGAVALVFNSFTDRTPGGPVVLSAINAATANQVMGAPVSVIAADVTFPLAPDGTASRVQVKVSRTAARLNPVATLMGAFFGVQTVDVDAVATAEASPANAETCVKPFTIPDKWIENQTGPWDPDDTFDVYGGGGRVLPNADVYIPAGQPGYTGYNADRDRGTRLILKANNSNSVSPSFYNPWDLPGSTGASDYRSNISGCNTALIRIGEPMTAEPGNMVGPTKQGTDDLVARDPSAYWDQHCNCVMGSAFGTSPRVAIIPLYDPMVYETGKQNGRNADLVIANYLGFFIESMQGNQVVGRITPVGGVFAANGGPAPAGAFPKAIRLVQ